MAAWLKLCQDRWPGLARREWRETQSPAAAVLVQRRTSRHKSMKTRRARCKAWQRDTRAFSSPAILPLRGHSERWHGLSPGLPPRSPANGARKQSWHFLRGCEGELLKKSLRWRWSRRAQTTGVTTSLSTYQKPAAPCKYSRFAEGLVTGADGRKDAGMT